MVSRRNFFNICIMMVVLLFMFQFSQVIKEQGNNYDVNEYLEESALSGAGQWRADEDLQDKEYVLFIGSADGAVGRIVSQWCNYTKRNHAVMPGIGEFIPGTDNPPEMILIDSRAVDFTEDTAILAEIAEAGIPLVFCNLPEASVIKGNEQLQQLLGIAEVVSAQTEVEGIMLYAGFLLGGELIYQVQEEEDEEKQDLDIQVPWYITGKGTKTYMAGLLDEDEVEREKFPALVWRHSYDGTMVFAVNGSYLSDLTGLGILDAFVYELSPYQVYPVINARNTVVANYPGFAPENDDKIQELYSRSTEAVFRDIMWPGFCALAEKNKMKMTFFMTPQYYYTDWVEPSGEQLFFYLQQMKEINAEAGLTLEYAGDAALKEKLERDMAFFASVESTYQFGAYYAGREMSQELDELLRGQEAMQEVHTIICSLEDAYPLVSYYTDSVTLQGITASAGHYTYSQDLRMRSILTALGYSNVLLDIHNAVWPQSQNDQWENYFDEISSNVGTYWSRYQDFSSTTLSESDTRVRSFLNLEYQEMRSDDTITLRVDNAGEDAWFVLHTHGEIVVRAEGAECEEMEEAFYLIHMLSDVAQIDLEEAGL